MDITRRRVLLLMLLVASLGESCAPQPIQSWGGGMQRSRGRTYLETFDDGPGGWYADRRYALPVWDGVAYCHGPWFLDANHAPPGAGYLHLVMWLYTHRRWLAPNPRRSLPYTSNRFLEQGHTTDFRNARLTVRLRGRIDLKGAQLLLLVHSENDGKNVNLVLDGQPFQITPDWSEQSVTLAPESAQWTCLGGRHDMLDTRVCADAAEVLADVNANIIFVLFPLEVVPLCADVRHPHELRAGVDYPVDPSHLPQGLLMFDTVKIEFAGESESL